MKKFLNIDLGFKVALTLIFAFGLTCVFMARADSDQRDTMPQYWHQQWKDDMETTLNEYVEKAGGTFTGEIILSNGNGVSLTTNGAAARAGIVSLSSGTGLVSTTEISAKSIVNMSWQLTNGTSTLGYLALSTKTVGTSFTIAAYTNTAAGVPVINSTATGPVGWVMTETYP